MKELVKFDTKNGERPIDVSGKRLYLGDKIATAFSGKSELKLLVIRNFTRYKICVIDTEGNYRTRYPYQVSLVERGAAL